MVAVADVFDDLIGHAPVIDLLRSEVRNPAQAYLFVGPASTGKASAARRFAAALMCGTDAECIRRVMEGAHPDVVLVEPDGRRSITVDQARHTVAQASLAPLEGVHKVFLFEEGGLMNDEAANALLKTLEEPTRSTIFLLVAESDDDLPETVASRCRKVVFGRVSEDEVRDGLMRIGIDAEPAAQAARISGGRPGLARALAMEPDVATYRRVWLNVPLQLPEHPGDAYVLAEQVTAAADPLLAALKKRHADEASAFQAEGGIGKAVQERHDRALKRASSALFISGLEILAGFYRDAAAAQFGGSVRNSDVPPKSFTTVHPSRAIRNAERVLDTIDALHANQRPQLAFAALFSDLSGDS
jgi:DNA polymerase-3 subunit delta'